jgi:hypothetical protein
MIYKPQKYYSGDEIKKNVMVGWSMWLVRETGEVYPGFSWGNLRERDHLEDVG